MYLYLLHVKAIKLVECEFVQISQELRTRLQPADGLQHVSLWESRWQSVSALCECLSRLTADGLQHVSLWESRWQCVSPLRVSQPADGWRLTACITVRITLTECVSPLRVSQPADGWRLTACITVRITLTVCQPSASVSAGWRLTAYSMYHCENHADRVCQPSACVSAGWRLTADSMYHCENHADSVSALCVCLSQLLTVYPQGDRLRGGARLAGRHAHVDALVLDGGMADPEGAVWHDDGATAIPSHFDVPPALHCALASRHVHPVLCPVDDRRGHAARLARHLNGVVNDDGELVEVVGDGGRHCDTAAGWQSASCRRTCSQLHSGLLSEHTSTMRRQTSCH